jgi:hypothetical protein
MTTRTLVAGVGNVFQGDDAFGVEVIKLLASRPRPAGVEVADFGIRGVHLVYELLNGCDLFVLVDAAQRGYEPGTVTVLEVGPAGTGPAGTGPADRVPRDARLDGEPSRAQPRRGLRARRREPGDGTVGAGAGGVAARRPRGGGNH